LSWGALEAATGSLYSYTSSLNNKTSSFATTGSNTFVGNQVVSGSIVQSGSFTTTGTIIAQTINVQTVTSSIIYSSGSNIFGNALNDSQKFTGSVLITGSLTSTGATCFVGNTTISTAGNTTLTINGTSGVPALSFTNTGGTNNIYGGVGSTANITIAPGDVNAVKIFAAGCISCFAGAIVGGNTLTINTPVSSTSIALWGRSSDNYSALRFQSNTGTTTYATIYSNASDLIFENSGSARLTINSTGAACFYGQVCACTLVTNGGDSQQLLVRGAEADLWLCSTGGGAGVFRLLGSTGNTTRLFRIYDNNNASNRLTIDGNGVTNFGCQICTPFVSAASVDVSTGGASCPTTACVGYGIFGYSGVGLGITAGASGGNQGIGFFVCGVERGRWISSGNLGIGTLCPSAKLDIRGGSDGDGMISIGSPSVSGILNSPANVYINADSDNDSSGVIGFGFNRTGYTGGTEVMRILETGKVGIGISNPTRELHLGVANAVLRVGPDYVVLNGSTDRDYIDLIAGGSQSIIAAPNESFLIVNTGGGGASPCIDIIAGGSGGVRLTNTATSWAGISDIRAKDIIEPVTNAVAKLSNLSTIIYKLKGDETNQRKIGLIAQEVNEVFPEVVDIPSDTCIMWGVRYSELTPVLVKAIQEQQTTICAQAGRIRLLESCLGIA